MHFSTSIYVYHLLSMSAPPPLEYLTWKYGNPFVTLWVSVTIIYFWSQTLVRMCHMQSVHVIYVHTWLPMSCWPPHMHTVTWKDCVPQHSTVWVLSVKQPTSGPTPLVRNVYMHQDMYIMSTCLPMSPSPHLHTYMWERGSFVCVSFT